MVRRYYDDTNYQIGTTPQTLLPLRRLAVPIPDQVVGDTASTFHVRADLSRVGDGFVWVDWIWDTIKGIDISKLLSFLEGGDWIDIYVATDIRTGVEGLPRNNFAVYYGKMWRPSLAGREGSPIARSPYTFQSVKLLFRDLIEQPGYL